MKIAEVTIAGKVLRLSPLSAENLAAFREAVLKLQEADARGDADDALQNVGNFVYLAAKPNHPDLSLLDVIDQSTRQELLDAMVALSKVQLDDTMRRER